MLLQFDDNLRRALTSKSQGPAIFIPIDDSLIALLHANACLVINSIIFYYIHA